MGALFAPLERIMFPHGCLLFSKNKNIDHLFIAHNDGFPYAALIVMYYFASDAIMDPEFVKPYRAITVNNTEYTELSPTLFDQLALFKYATLERDELYEEDPRWTTISFNIDSLLDDMINNQKPTPETF